jgi:signal transduction histidine kinase/CheY-like chemotaxis protein
MSTAGKLWLGFGLLLALLVGTGLFVAHRLASIERSLVTIMAVQEPATAATYEMAVNVISTRATVLHYVTVGDSTDLSKIVALDREFRDFKTRFDLVTRTPTSRELAARIDDAYQQFHLLGDTLIRASDQWRGESAAFARRSEEVAALATAATEAVEGDGKDAQRRRLETESMEADIAAIGAAVGLYLPSLDERHRTRVSSHAERFRATIARYRQAKLTAEQQARADRLETTFASYVDDARLTMDRRSALRERWTRFTRSGGRVEVLVDEGIRSLARTDLIVAQRSARLAIRTSLIAVLVLLVAGIVIGTGTAIPTARSIVHAERTLRAHMSDLSAAHERKDEFLGVLGHELRNPLAPLSNALHVLDGHASEVPEEVRRVHAMMKRQVRSMTRLVDDLLDVSRINQGKITLRRETVDLAAVAADTLEDLRPLADAHGHRLRLALPSGPLWLDADPTRMAQITANLLHNAIRYTPDGGRITIEVRRAGDEAVLEVSDNGIGIAPEMLPHVFEPFTQAEPPTSSPGGGLGIGLALVRRLVEMHGGIATAESAGLRRGSRFTVRLPALASAPPQALVRRREMEAPRGRRILVVDDNQDSAETMASLLRLWGHEVTVANDGPAALAAARSAQPDLALLDIGLPGMDGYEVARTIRADDALRSTHLVALSGYALPEDLKKAEEAGFEGHLAKPPRLDELAALFVPADHPQTRV